MFLLCCSLIVTDIKACSVLTIQWNPQLYEPVIF